LKKSSPLFQRGVGGDFKGWSNHPAFAGHVLVAPKRFGSSEGRLNQQKNVIAGSLPDAKHRVINGRNTRCHCEQTLGLRGNLSIPRLLHFIRNDPFVALKAHVALNNRIFRSCKRFGKYKRHQKN